MADNDQNDEYKFDELESYDHESMDNVEHGANPSAAKDHTLKSPKKDVLRNALIAVGVIIVAMVAYKLAGSLFSGKSSSTASKATITPAPIAEIKPQQQTQATIQPQPVVSAEITPQPVQTAQPVVQENILVLKQQVESISTNQQNVQSQVASVSDQVGNVNTNVSNLTAQVNQLNQTISALTTQLSKQSEEINILMDRTKPKLIRRHIRPQRIGEANIFYINAVIPGRAWLIGTNGSTLTVREGTKIAGYGMVKLIDSMQGRILTSSGRIISFSQEDS